MITRTIFHYRLINPFLVALGLIALATISSPCLAQGFSVAYGDQDFKVAPGDSIMTSFRVTNSSTERMSLRVYLGDWDRIPDKITGYEFDVEGGKEARSLVKWMTFSPNQIDIGPGETQEVHCQVDFPDDPSLEGSYWGVVFVEQAQKPEPGNPQPHSGGMAVGVDTVFRYAVKIYATFKDTEIRDAGFTSMDIQKVDTGINVKAIFQNRGNIFLRPKVWLEIRDTQGNVVMTQDYVRQTVLPATSRLYTFELKDLTIPPGTYLVLVIADYDGPKLVAAQGRMVLTTQ